MQNMLITFPISCMKNTQRPMRVTFRSHRNEICLSHSSSLAFFPSFSLSLLFCVIICAHYHFFVSFVDVEMALSAVKLCILWKTNKDFNFERSLFAYENIRWDRGKYMQCSQWHHVIAHLHVRAEKYCPNIIPQNMKRVSTSFNSHLM